MYLITGASGNVGSRIVGELEKQHLPIRVLTSDPSKVAKFDGNVEVVVGGFGQPGTLRNALAGVSHVFLMNRGLTSESLSALLQIAYENSCRRIVFLSSITAQLPELTLGNMHLQQENAILASPLQARVVRATAFMSNTLQWVQTIKTQGTVYNPMGDGSFAPIAPEDIAAFAARMLVDDKDYEQISSITGPGLVTAAQQVSILSGVLEVPIRCIDITDEQAVEQIVRTGLPRPMASAVAELYNVVRSGASAQVLPTFERVMGYKPRTFLTWAQQNKQRFI